MYCISIYFCGTFYDHFQDNSVKFAINERNPSCISGVKIILSYVTYVCAT